MRRVGKAIALLMIAVILSSIWLPENIHSVMAAETASVKVSGGSVTVGQSINVKVTISANVDVAMYRFTLQFDTEYLQFKSSDYKGPEYLEESGKVTVIVDAVSELPQDLILPFKALKIGETSVSLSGVEVNPTDSKYGDNLDPQIKNGTVTIKAPYQASSDCNLKSLQISEGTLSPAFSKGTTEYSAEVGGGCSSLKITAVANDSKASVKVSGNKDLKEGSNTVKIVVTAENGDTKTYKINVTRGKMSPTPTPTVGATVTIGDDELTIRDVIQSAYPDGFEKSTMEYKDFPVECLVNLAGTLTVVEMSDGNLYVYNAEKNSFSRYTEVTGKMYPIILVDPTADAVVPAGYTEVTRTFAGAERTVYQAGEESNYFLFWGMNGEGNTSWYQFCIPDQSIQLLNVEQISITPTPLPTNTPTLTATPTLSPIPTDIVKADVPESSTKEKTDNTQFLGWIVAGFCGLLSILFLALFLKEKNNKVEGQETESEETEYQISNTEYAKAVEMGNAPSTEGTDQSKESSEEAPVVSESAENVPVENVALKPSGGEELEPLPEIIFPAEENFSAGEPEGQPVTINIENTEEVSKSLANVLLQEIEKLEKEDHHSN